MVVIVAIGACLYLFGTSLQKSNNVELRVESNETSQSEKPLDYVEPHKQGGALEVAQDDGDRIEANENTNAASSSSEHSLGYTDPTSSSALPSGVDVIDSTDLFTINDNGHEQEPTNPDFRTYGKSIELNVFKLRNLKENQTVNIPLDVNRIMQVDKVERRKNGTVKLNLSFPGKSKIYRAFIIIGKKATFGRIITPEGGFELEVVNGKGWIVDTRNIDDKFPENGIDYVVPN